MQRVEVVGTELTVVGDVDRGAPAATIVARLDEPEHPTRFAETRDDLGHHIDGIDRPVGAEGELGWRLGPDLDRSERVANLAGGLSVECDVEPTVGTAVWRGDPRGRHDAAGRDGDHRGGAHRRRGTQRRTRLEADGIAVAPEQRDQHEHSRRTPSCVIPHPASFGAPRPGDQNPTLSEPTSVRCGNGWKKKYFRLKRLSTPTAACRCEFTAQLTRVSATSQSLKPW